MGRSLVILGVVIIQVGVIVVLGVHIYDKKNSLVLGDVSVMPLHKENVVSSGSGDLKHFYELTPDIVMEDDPSIPIASSYTINKDGLNERFDYSIEKPDDTYRIVALGDSFTFGLFVPTSQNWTELLEDRMRQACDDITVDILNLGVGGYDIQYAAERYRLRGEKYNPDLIIWLLKDDDFNLINELFLETAFAYEREFENDPEYDEKYIDKGDYYPAWRIAADELFSDYSRNELYTISTGHLEDFVSTVDRRIVLALLPEFTDKTRTAAERVASDRVSVYEISQNIYEDPNLFYPVDSHPTAEGHRVIAEDLYDYLLSSGTVSCN